MACVLAWAAAVRGSTVASVAARTAGGSPAPETADAALAWAAAASAAAVRGCSSRWNSHPTIAEHFGQLIACWRWPCEGTIDPSRVGHPGGSKDSVTHGEERRRIGPVRHVARRRVLGGGEQRQLDGRACE